MALRPVKLAKEGGRANPASATLQVFDVVGGEDEQIDYAARRAGGEKGGGRTVRFACVRALLRAKSEAHPRCPARHAKSGKRVRALISLPPPTVVDYESCDIGETEGGCRVGRILWPYRACDRQPVAIT